MRSRVAAMTTSETDRPQLGRRPGASVTREAILDAALDLFAHQGYEATSMRAVAAAAGVDPALVRHFFGHKENLFAATVLDRTDIATRLAVALDGDLRSVGRRLALAYLRLWEDPDAALPLTALARSALTSERTMNALIGLHMPDELVRSRIAPPGGADGLALAISHLFGTAVFRYIGRLPPLADKPLEQLVDDVAPVIQHYLVGERIG